MCDFIGRFNTKGRLTTKGLRQESDIHWFWMGTNTVRIHLKLYSAKSRRLKFNPSYKKKKLILILAPLYISLSIPPGPTSLFMYQTLQSFILDPSHLYITSTGNEIIGYKLSVSYFDIILKVLTPILTCFFLTSTPERGSFSSWLTPHKDLHPIFGPLYATFIFLK